ncbi:4'-phosphopantetheinyl transferase family protein [Pandoraea sputorum]|uniref:Uncharacterized protein n=1 Tax=Pandoraea sputorum TaxID=93222 RepID=A0A239SE74_9BURK|nr:hypothetical protein [Pandoraea sputorum]SNU83691.1 Uncharacterised protein [Pandoraea sputorum]VVD96089.1 hypothetical protein PSP20601_01882 [Pandoraea sputorum]
MLKRTVDLTPRVASIPTPSMTYVPLGQFGQGDRKLTGGAQNRALASSDIEAAKQGDGGQRTAVSPSPQCNSDELWLWRFLLAGRPFGATGAAAGGPDDGATWLSAAEHSLARRLPRTQMRHRFLSERIALRWIFGRWFRCTPAQAPVPTATPGVSSLECDGPHGKVWIDMAHAGLWLFVAMGQGPIALAAHAPTPVGTDDNAPLIAPASQSPSALDPIAVARDTAHRLCLARLAGEGESLTAGADVPLLAHPYVSVPYAGQTRYLYDMSVSSRLTVVAARDSIVHRMRAFGWQN